MLLLSVADAESQIKNDGRHVFNCSMAKETGVSMVESFTKI